MPGVISVSDVLALIALVVSIIAAATSCYFALRQNTTSREANSLPTFTELFQEHRSPEQAEARSFLGSHEFQALDLSQGLEALPPDKQQSVRALMWFYDNVGALVAHGIVDPEPVSAYLGGSVIRSWEQLEPLIMKERENRKDSPDPERWQAYFGNLYVMFRDEVRPARSREAAKHWRAKSARSD
jgi:hypothetical protein